MSRSRPPRRPGRPATTSSSLRPTGRGVATLIGGLAAAVAGWLLGLPELTVLATAAAATVLAGAMSVGARRFPLELVRSARPARLQVGEPCEIRLTATNSSNRNSPVVELADDVGRSGRARLMLAPVPPGGRTTATYALPTDRRGVHQVGPLTWTVTDPFGLSTRATVEHRRLAITVTPRTWELAPLPPAPGDEPDHGTRSLTSAATLDEEFASLRDYVPGDDIRRIHWRSTARRGSPVVRQFDVPWQRRTTIVADLRLDRHDDASFERMISVVASLVELAARRDELTRLVSSATGDTGFLEASEHLDDLLDRLTVVEPELRGGEAPGPLVSRSLVAPGAGGRVVSCIGGVTAAEQSALDIAGQRGGLHVVVSTATGGEVIVPNAHVVNWDGRDALERVWARAIAPLRPVGAT